MDEDLIAAVAGGDDAALRELFARHAPWLAARLRTMLAAADVEDVLQETFLAAWRGAARFRPDGPVAGWLWGIARRQAALFLRRRGPAGLPLPEESAEVPGGVDPAEVAVWRAEVAEALALLGAAGGPDREVWRRLYLEDQSVAEVASALGVPAGTVKSRAHRARRALRAAFRRSVAEGGA